MSRALKTPKVLLVWDTPTQSLSAGWTRYALERRFGAGVDRRAHQLAWRAPTSTTTTSSSCRREISRGTINDAVLNRIKDWLRGGGTLVTVAEASRWATGSSVGLLDTTSLLKDGRPDVPPPAGGRCVRCVGCGGCIGSAEAR